MLKTAGVFVLASLTSFVLFVPLSGLMGMWSTFWLATLLEQPAFLVGMMLTWVPVWLWVVAIRRAWHGSAKAESVVDLNKSFLH